MFILIFCFTNLGSCFVADLSIISYSINFEKVKKKNKLRICGTSKVL